MPIGPWSQNATGVEAYRANQRTAALEAELGRVKAEREHAIAEVECLWMAITSHCSSETIKAIEAELVTK